MTTLESALQRIAADLRRSNVDFALIGGLAVSVRTEPRFTRDADFAVAVAGDLEAEALIRSLRTHGYDVQALVEQDAVGRLATVRLAVAGERGPVLDLLFASSGIEREVVSAAEPLELLPGLTVKVARVGHLVALKILSRDDVRRPQDVADLRALLRVATAADIASAREALGLFTGAATTANETLSHNSRRCWPSWNRRRRGAATSGRRIRVRVERPLRLARRGNFATE